MPIGAIAGATVVAGVGSAAIGSRATKKAAGKAADTSLQAARENNALAREFRNENTANLAPWMASGRRSNALVDSFLFGPQAAPAQAQTQPAQQTGGGFGSTPGVGPFGGRFSGFPRDMAGGVSDFNMGVGQRFNRRSFGTQQFGQAQPVPGTVSTTAAPQGNAMMSGYDAFTASPYYQFPLQEGMNQLNHGFAARGLIQSGAAMKAAQEYGQNYAHGRMGEFIGLAERQSDRGIQGASAIAGVGQNALASMTANNTNAANAAGNAHLARGAANANMWGNVGSSVGNALGMMGSSYINRGY